MAFFNTTMAPLAGRLVLVFTSLAFFLSACTLENNIVKTKQADPLAGTHWQLDKITGLTMQFKRQPTLLFDHNRMSGYTGCNRFFSNYRASNDGILAMGQLGMTRMACNGVNHELEQHYTQALRQVRTYALTQSRLSLLDANHKVLITLRPQTTQ